jgi:hypothetical protein
MATVQNTSAQVMPQTRPSAMERAAPGTPNHSEPTSDDIVPFARCFPVRTDTMSANGKLPSAAPTRSKDPRDTHRRRFSRITVGTAAKTVTATAMIETASPSEMAACKGSIGLPPEKMFGPVLHDARPIRNMSTPAVGGTTAKPASNLSSARD